MKSMFAMGFTADVFGARVSSPMLGQVPLRGQGPVRLGQTVTNDGDALLRQLQMAENQVAAANQYIASHPNLAQDLGADFGAFQQNMAVISSVADVETQVSMELQATPAGQQYVTTESNYNAVQSYIAAAAALAGAMSAHPNISPATNTASGTPVVAPAPAPGATRLIPPQAPGTAPRSVATTPAKSDLTTPLLVGGGVLAIGLVALLARV